MMHFKGSRIADIVWDGEDHNVCSGDLGIRQSRGTAPAGGGPAARACSNWVAESVIQSSIPGPVAEPGLMGARCLADKSSIDYTDPATGCSVE
jgi:hypothetical protein